MHTNYLILLLCIANLWTCSSQELEGPQNAFYVEALGQGGLGSLNYERTVYRHNRFDIGVRLGLSTHHLRDSQKKFNPDFIIPISINFLYGKKFKGEFGIGNTFSNIVHTTSDLSVERRTSMHGSLYLGFRIQWMAKKGLLAGSGGWLFRMGYSPIIENFSHFRHWGGISFGLLF